VYFGLNYVFWARFCILGPNVYFGPFLFRAARLKHDTFSEIWAGTTRPEFNTGPGRPEIKRAGPFRAWAGPGRAAQMYTYSANCACSDSGAHCSALNAVADDRCARSSRCSTGTPDSPVNYSGASSDFLEGSELSFECPGVLDNVRWHTGQSVASD
jgi:hypothetical protein